MSSNVNDKVKILKGSLVKKTNMPSNNVSVSALTLVTFIIPRYIIEREIFYSVTLNENKRNKFNRESSIF